MTDSGGSGSLDAFMLELFCSEVETQVTLLSDGLLTLEGAPQDAAGLEALMRAAHSIKGAARIVQLDIVVELAHALEDSFVAAQEGRLVLAGETLEVSLRGADQLAFLAELKAGELNSWLAAHEAKMREATGALRALLQTGAEAQEETPPSPQPGVAPQPEPSPVVQPATDAAVSTPLESQAPAKTAGSEQEAGAPEAFMLELFCSEVETQATALSDGLLALERAPQDAASLEALMRAAHSIKGAARIVQLDVVVELAHALEDCFVAAQEGRLVLARESLEVIIRGVDQLTSLAKLKAAELAAWLSAHAAEMRAATVILRTLLQTAASAGVRARLSSEQVATAAQPEPSRAAQPPVVLLPSAPVDKTRPVRVTAENLSRLLGLAEESLVEARWLPPFAASLLRLQKSQRELAEVLEKLQEALMGADLPERARDSLTSAQLKAEGCYQVLADRLDELESLVGRSVDLSERLSAAAVTTRMRPFVDGAQGFPRMVRDLARKLGKQVKVDIVGQSTPVDRDILEKLEAPLTHLLRNAIDHGIETPEERLAAGKPAEGTVRLEARHQRGMLAITVADDGDGADIDRLRQKIIDKQLATADLVNALPESQLLKFLFAPGFSTATEVTEVSGRGVGLDVVQNVIQEVGGTLRAVSQPGKGMSFHLQLPLTLSVMRALLVEVAGEPYAFPLARVDQVVTVPLEEIAVRDDRWSFLLDGQYIAVVPASQVWQLPESEVSANPLPVVVISDDDARYGVAVDAFLGERDIVVRPLDARLGRVPGIGAAALLKDGSPALIVDIEDLARSIDTLLTGGQVHDVPRSASDRSPTPRKRVLVVDDSTTMRTVERDILTRNGYEVDVAEDGMEGWDAIRLGHYDLLVTDVEMPRMNGLQLVSLVKHEPWLLSTPVLIVSGNEREEDRRLGLAAGASDYLTKSSFREETFVHVVVNLIGEADG